MTKGILQFAALIALLALGGCPAEGDDDTTAGDDDTTAGDDDTTAGDDDTTAGDDDTTAGDDDTTAGDDDTAEECDSAVPCKGSYVITLESEMEAIEGCENVTGDLEIHTESEWLESIHLPCLTAVGGRLSIHENPALTSVELPALVTVAGDVSVYDPDSAISHLSMPSLTSVGDSLYIEPAHALASLDVSSLETVTGMLKLYQTDLLVDFDTPVLATVGLLAVRDNLALAGLDGFSNLTSVDHFYLDNNPVVTSLASLANLTTVNGELYILGHACLDPTEIDAFVAGLSVSGPVTLEDNGASYPCN